MESNVIFTDEIILANAKELYDLYQTRPIENNHGGMCLPHLLPTWLAMKLLQPKYIIESGVFKGQGTYFMRKACPDAKIFCIEPLPKQIEYRDDKAVYFEKDFSLIQWSKFIPKKERKNAIIFFDDHQNALERIKQCKALGFTQMMFEDNYPKKVGNCVSLKQNIDNLPPEITTYFEFPPMFVLPVTRWGRNWDEYPTKKPLLTKPVNEWQERYFKEAKYYTWICYVELLGK